MFETAADLWKEYVPLVHGPWPEEDPRHDLAVEVANRLRQLDRILVHLHTALDPLTPDPDEDQRRRESEMENRLRLITGKITQEEYVSAVTQQSPQEIAVYFNSWEDVAIFTETFYFFAWRMIEVLNRSKPYAFPGLDTVKGRAITIVRNNLIEHPEKEKKDPNFTNTLVLTSTGPVLRPRVVVLRLDMGNLHPHPDGKDQGLFAAAEELRDELQSRFSDAIERNRRKSPTAP